MEINLNCDLGEKSIHSDGKNDFPLLKIINTANIACGFHAGDNVIINNTIVEAKKNNVSVGAHPSFKDKINFGRKKMYLSKNELIKIIYEQLEIIYKISLNNNWPITHVKPHGALNNMACENYEIALIIGQCIKNFNKDLIYVVLPLNEMEKAAKNLNIKYACEIFADRNYEDNGQLVSRSLKHSMIQNPIISVNNILEMLENSYIKCYSGKKIKCKIDTICIHGDELNAVTTANLIKTKLLENNIKLTNLDELKKFN